MARTRFQWTTGVPLGAPANPTYGSGPMKEDAVDYKVKVFWPGMAKWYSGRVRSYDPETGCHEIAYMDGDTQVRINGCQIGTRCPILHAR
jgi:hypothetical protein